MDIQQERPDDAGDEHQYRLLFEANPNPMFVFDEETYRFLAVNAEAVQHYGWSREEFLALGILDIRPVEDRELARQIIERNRNARENRVGIVRHCRKDGSVREMEIVASTVRFDGRNARLCSLNDITERKATEEELARQRARLETSLLDLKEAKEAAEAADRAKSNFLGNISHEMRTPLHQILGLAQLIGLEPLSAKQADRLAKLDLCGQRLAAIIEGILKLTEIETGRLLTNEEPVDLAALLAEVAQLAQSRADDKGLRLAVENAVPAGTLRGDARHLKTALLCYVNNAITFTTAGSVTLRAAVVEDNAQDILLRCEVSDTGIGIPPEAQPRLFNIFEQVDNSSSRQYGGTGIGLAMVRKLAVAMGGDAGCSSRPGAGSTFWFTARLGKP